MGTLDGALQDAVQAITGALGTTVTIEHRSAGNTYNPTTGTPNVSKVSNAVKATFTQNRVEGVDGVQRLRRQLVVARKDLVAPLRRDDEVVTAAGVVFTVTFVEPLQATDEDAAYVADLAGPA